MSILHMALEANLPFISTNTDDVLYVDKIINYWAGGKSVIGLSDEDLESVLSMGEVFYTSNPSYLTQAGYRILRNAKKSLIFLNLDDTCNLTYEIGTLVAPNELKIEIFKKANPDADLESLLPTVGGLTLKDIFELCKISQSVHNTLTEKSLLKSRMSYMRGSTKGIEQVNTEYDFYKVPSELKNWGDKHLPLFIKPVHERLTPRGVLLGGIAGTGKTMAAKYIANELNVPLYRLDIGSVKGKYVGESEQNLNHALQQLEEASPCVVLIDEVEKTFNKGTTYDGGVTTGIMGSILWWLQEHKLPIFTVMTTNNVDAIPPELFREGRINTKLQMRGLRGDDAIGEFIAEVIASMRAELPTISTEQWEIVTTEALKASTVNKTAEISQASIREKVQTQIINVLG